LNMGCALRDRRWCCARLKILERERASVREEKERQLTDPLVSCEIPSQFVGFAAPAWLEVCFAVDCKIFLSFFFFFFLFFVFGRSVILFLICYSPSPPFVGFFSVVVGLVAALCGFLLCRRGSRLCPSWIFAVLGLHCRGSPLR
jgi:hypothetical protein